MQGRGMPWHRLRTLLLFLLAVEGRRLVAPTGAYTRPWAAYSSLAASPGGQSWRCSPPLMHPCLDLSLFGFRTKGTTVTKWGQITVSEKSTAVGQPAEQWQLSSVIMPPSGEQPLGCACLHARPEKTARHCNAFHAFYARIVLVRHPRHDAARISPRLIIAIQN